MRCPRVTVSFLEPHVRLAIVVVFWVLIHRVTVHSGCEIDGRSMGDRWEIDGIKPYRSMGDRWEIVGMSEIAAIRTSLPIAHELRTLLQSYTPTYGFMLYILPYGAVLMSYSSSRNGTPESLRVH